MRNKIIKSAMILILTGSSLIMSSCSFSASAAQTEPVVSDGRPETKSNEGAAVERTQPNAVRQPVISNQTSSAVTAPDELVRQFYSWYLAEIRAGREPFNQDDKMLQFVTGEFMSEYRKNALPKFDPVLALPKPESNWQSMRVATGKPTFYHRKGLYDAYVLVNYKGFNDPVAKANKGMVSIEDEWSIGLTKTAAGWRIASIGL